MVRLFALVLGLIAVTSVSACGDSCENLQDDFDKITQEISKNTDTVFDRVDELEELGKKMEENGCLDR